jgi:hypothetical protein
MRAFIAAFENVCCNNALPGTYGGIGAFGLGDRVCSKIESWPIQVSILQGVGGSMAVVITVSLAIVWGIARLKYAWEDRGEKREAGNC